MERALDFLNDPQLKDASLFKKISFLKSKGIDDDMIEKAIESEPIRSEPSRESTVPILPIRHTADPNTSGFFSNLVFSTGITLSLFHLFKNYLGSLLPDWPLFPAETASLKSDIQSLKTTWEDLSLKWSIQQDQLAQYQKDWELLKQHCESLELLFQEWQSTVKETQKGWMNDMMQEIYSLKMLWKSRETIENKISSSGLPEWQQPNDKSDLAV